MQTRKFIFKFGPLFLRAICAGCLNCILSKKQKEKKGNMQ